MPNSSYQVVSLRLAFWLALAFAVTMALLPHPPSLPIDSWGDKSEHMLAFAVMAALGANAFQAMPLMRLGERLSFVGALIEVFQSIPALHRDCDIRDWLADTVAVVVVLLIVRMVRRKRIVTYMAPALPESRPERRFE